jgi:hypothetical protein
MPRALDERGPDRGTPPRPLREILADASSREPLDRPDGKSGARLERVVVDGRALILKHLDVRHDWVARATGDVDPRAVRAWKAGLLDLIPACLDHAIIACDHLPGSRAGGMLMRDVGPSLLPEGQAPVPLHQHRRFLEHMAALHAAFWGFDDTLGLLKPAGRYLMLSPWVADAERARGEGHDVPERLLWQGWRRLKAMGSASGTLAGRLVTDPGPLVGPLAETPTTLIHGDWKFGNLGTGGDGRTILLDWTVFGPGPPCADLAWYLAVNTARLPETKEATMSAYRRALEERGIDTSGWWQRQLGLSLIGAFVLLGWEKTGGDRSELAWWEQAVAGARRWLA